MAGNDGNILMEGATLLFKNFAGKEGQYNREGDRNFCVALDDELADKLEHDGWNVKSLRVREEGETPQRYIQVSVKYRGKDGSKVRPPVIVLIGSRGRNTIDEDLCEIVDQVDIANVDLIIRPYEWAVSGNTGIKAYLKSLYITIEEDYLDRKYQHVLEVGEEPKAIESGSDDIVDAEAWYVDEDQKALEG